VRKLNPFNLTESMPYEMMQHIGVVGDTFWYVTEDKLASLIHSRLPFERHDVVPFRDYIIR